MRLGLSVACYRWVCYPPTRTDIAGVHLMNVSQPAFLSYGRPLPYVSSIQGPEPGKHIEWIVARACVLGLSPLYIGADWIVDDAHAFWLREYLRERDTELITGADADFALPPGEAWSAGRDRFIRQMELSRAAGATIVSAVHDGAIEHNHFSKNPPIDVQIERMIANFGELVAHAERIGVVMAFENHMDYRCSEMATVIAAVDSPWLRVNFDFGNCFSVIEDPVDAARSIARWTVMTHVKDMRVQPKTLEGEPRIMWAPIGDGSVDIAEIMRILQAETPGFETLPQCLEVAPLPDQDPDLWVRKSIGWMDRTYGHLFEDSARRAGSG